MPHRICYIKTDQVSCKEVAAQLDYLTRDISFITEKLVKLGAEGDMESLKECEQELNLALSAYMLVRDRAMDEFDGSNDFKS